MPSQIGMPVSFIFPCLLGLVDRFAEKRPSKSNSGDGSVIWMRRGGEAFLDSRLVGWAIEAPTACRGVVCN